MINYNDMVAKVEKDHGIKFRGYGRTKKQDDKCEGVYLDFWHQILDTHDVSNPCEIEIDFVKIITNIRYINPEIRDAVIKSEVNGAEMMKEHQDDLDGKNGMVWKLDIISKIMKSYPNAISDSLKLKVFIEW